MVFNSHDSRYVPFHKWLEENIIDVDEDIIVHVLALCYEIWCARNKKCFEGTDVDVAATIQKAQRSIGSFKSASTVLVETLSEGPIEGDKWDIGVVVRDNEGVVVGASS
ncbi:hypothetical protein MTR_4g098825 [Medicago truncatula]|uniref:Uncharacterized protein n=1 Tax=Medicago truncatula TaxID=3880 RepID=A0A072V0A9_MEDTR|nr:hypothetical protein MTR_4g098825 [Medicago truncatula]